MQFSVVVLALATSALALPNLGPSAQGSGKSKGKGKDEKHRFAVPDDVTVNQAETKCGSDNQLSCCNKISSAQDTNIISSGLISLSSLLGAGPGAEGVSLFDGCSPLIGDVVNHQCENIAACCQNSPSSAVS
jgi:hypothetical protein